MGHSVWLYHKCHGSKLFDSDDLKKMEQEGWRDTPKKAQEVEEKVKKRGDK